MHVERLHLKVNLTVSESLEVCIQFPMRGIINDSIFLISVHMYTDCACVSYSLNP